MTDRDALMARMKYAADERTGYERYCAGSIASGICITATDLRALIAIIEADPRHTSPAEPLASPSPAQTETATNCDWPALGVFRFADDPGEHDPCYVVMPDGASLAVNHHAGPGVDIARAKFIVDACNAALFRSPETEPSFKLSDKAKADLDAMTQAQAAAPDLRDFLVGSPSPSPAQWPEDVVERAARAMCNHVNAYDRWDCLNASAKMAYRNKALAALATLPPPEGDVKP